ncbi:hypothetical protein ACVPOR_15135 [Staphylococcus aureus]
MIFYAFDLEDYIRRVIFMNHMNSFIR